LWVWLLVLLHHVHVLDDDLLIIHDTLERSHENLYLSGQNDYVVPLSDLAHSPITHRTSGAREMIFMNFSPPQLPGHRSQISEYDGLQLMFQENRRVAVETNKRAIRTADTGTGAHNHGIIGRRAFLTLPRGIASLRLPCDVTDAGIMPMRAAEHLDALHALGRHYYRQRPDWSASESLSVS
jgi:hypothetical protein